MVIRVVFRFGPRPSSDGLRQIRYRELISAAARTPYYEPWILGGTGWSEAEIAQLPCVEMEHVRDHPEQFRSATASAARKPDIWFPFPRPSRTAVLGAGYHQNRGVRCFPRWTPHMNLFQPEVLAGPVERLRSLALGVIRKRVRLAPPERAVLAFTGPDCGRLDNDDRDLFWRAYQVPVFEQFQLAGETLASECEAHTGLHVLTERAIVEFRDDAHGKELVVSCLRPGSVPMLRWATGFTADIDNGTCGCGQATPRLELVVPKALPAPEPRPRVLAAAAGG